MKLYEFPPTRSIRVRWTLQEQGVDFEAVRVNLVATENRSPELLAINPAGMETLYARPSAPPRIADAFASIRAES